MTRKEVESFGKEELKRPLFILWFGLLVWFDLQTTIILTGKISNPRTRLLIMIKSVMILLVFLYIVRELD